MVLMIAASRAWRIRAFWGVSLLVVGDVVRGTVCNGRHCHCIVHFNTNGLAATARLRLYIPLDALQRRLCQEKINRLACVPGNEF